MVCSLRDAMIDKDGGGQGYRAARAKCHKVVARLQAVAGLRRSYRQRGQAGGGQSWLMKSPLARRMFRGEQASTSLWSIL